MSLLPPQPPATPVNHNSLNPPSASIFNSGGTPNLFSSPSSTLMQVTPDKDARRKLLGGGEGGVGSYRPVAYRTEGVRLACLVNASVTVCGEDSIYAFGGFDQYTDEVFNHVLRLDLHTYTWTLVDNYGDIPSVRMGHTTTYWREDKLIIFGGENEQRVFLSDVYIFDIPSATWSQPVLSGHPPCGRSRHAVVLHDDKLFILGGVHNNPIAQPSDYDPDDEVEYNPQEVLDDICYLDLKTMTWSRSWKWVARFDHQAWVREGKLWIFGGMGKEMDRTGELISLDLSHPVFARTEIKQMGYATRQPRVMFEATTGQGRVLRSHRSYGPNSPRPLFNPHRNTPPPKPNVVPAATSSIRFLWGRDIPSEAHGTHFHHLCGSTLLDFVTYANTIRSPETGLSALNLREMTWRKIADGVDMLGGANWRWHYLAIAPNSTTAYLLGCPTDNDEIGEGEEYLSDVLPIDLTQFGMHLDTQPGDTPVEGMLGWDLAKVFDSDDSSSDFIIRAMKDEATEGDEWDVEGMWGRSVIDTADNPHQHHNQGQDSNGNGNGSAVLPAAREDDDLPPENVMGPPIRCHKLILLSRWRHFTSLYNARMREYHRGRLYLPEPYTVVRAFLYYLYTDSIAKSVYCPDISTVAGILVMANLYDIARLRSLCLNRLYNELDVDSAAVVWERAGVASEDALRKKAAGFVLTYWGRVVRTRGFRRLSRRSLMELCEEVDEEGRVMGGEELGGFETAPGTPVMGMRGDGFVKADGGGGSGGGGDGSGGGDDGYGELDEDEEMG